MKDKSSTDKDIFRKLIKSVERFSEEDIDYLMEDLDNWGFFIMPASCRKHGCFEGGLVKHSINVCKIAQMLRSQMINS